MKDTELYEYIRLNLVNEGFDREVTVVVEFLLREIKRLEEDKKFYLETMQAIERVHAVRRALREGDEEL